MEINKERAEEAMRELVSALHREFCFSGLATEEQWDEEISPKLRALGNILEGLMPNSPTARVYKFPKQ